MPLYEYQCDACGHRFEVIQKFADPPVETCPLCGGAVHKLQSAPAFQFKGTGWYVTDYARKDQGSGGKPEGGAGRTDGKPAAGKSDAPKPAVSGETAAGGSKPAGESKTSSSAKKDA